MRELNLHSSLMPCTERYKTTKKKIDIKRLGNSKMLETQQKKIRLREENEIAGSKLIVLKLITISIHLDRKKQINLFRTKQIKQQITYYAKQLGCIRFSENYKISIQAVFFSKFCIGHLTDIS